MTPPLLAMQGIVKRFGGTHALDHAALEVERGEVHALMGENGSGKSTLMKVLAGIHRADAGSVVFGGGEKVICGPLAAARAGIAMVHQELNLVPTLPVAENLFLGREPRTRLGLAGFRQMRDQARAVFRDLGVDIDPQAPVETLPVALCQMAEIARALLMKARLLILDEPTSALADADVATLFRVLRALRADGTSIVYISHKMAEVMALADRYTVLRDGRTVAEGRVSGTPESAIIAAMVGRELGAYYPPRPTGRESAAGTIIRVDDLRRAAPGRPPVNGVSFTVAKGEIVAICGLVGAGRTEVLETLFGLAGSSWSGSITLDGSPFRPRHPQTAIRAGVAMLAEDRARLGILPGLSVLANATVAHLRRLSWHGLVSSHREREALSRQSGEMPIRRASDLSPIGSLSGGNQQKVLLARWLMTGPRLLLLDEPTRGIDVGAKAEIYRVLRHLAAQGIGVLFVSSELPEVLGLADRILVMSAGCITLDTPAAGASEAMLLRAAMAGFAREVPA